MKVQVGRGCHGWWICPVLATIWSLVGCAVSPRSEPPPKGFTLEQLYSLPRIIGTAPRAVTWAPDGLRFAFLWNDEGTNFYDVWTASVTEARPVRLTRMPRRTPAGKTAGSLEAVEEAVAIEREAGVQSVVWHPDGLRLLFTLRGDLYLVEPGQSPERITETPGPEIQSTFSPDGKWLSYLRAGDVWLQDVSAATPVAERQATRLASPGVAVERYSWSPDSTRIAIIETDGRKVPRRNIPDYLLPETDVVSVPRPLPGEDSGSRRIGVMALPGPAIRWFGMTATPVDPIFSLEWSPDSRSFLVDTSDLYVKDRRVLVVDASAGAVKEWYREQNPENVSAAWIARWAPDGQGIYLTSDRDEDYHVYLLVGPGAEPRRITSGNWAVETFQVPRRAGALFFVGNEGRPEERHLYRVALTGGPPTRLSRRSGNHAPVVSPDGKYAAVIFSSDRTPSDLFLTGAASPQGTDTDERQVTTSPLPAFRDYTWTKPRYVTFPSKVDGVTLHGRLTEPINIDRTKKYPAILGSVYSDTVRNQWGGRTAHPTWGLDQYLVQEGFVLLNVDMRGSSGHGKTFRAGIREKYGVVDIEDLASGVDYLKTLGYVDPGRIGIWGSSYGGLMTTMSLFKKPGVYKAGVAGAPATNVFHAMTGEMRVMMRPQDRRVQYEASSPYLHASGLQGHLMIIHGMRDTTVLFKDSLSLVQRLILFGKDVDLVALPDAQHGWDTEGLAQTVFAFKKLAGHFERHLGKGPR